MKAYTIAEAQKNLPALLEESKKGAVVIHGDFGDAFLLKAEPKSEVRDGKSLAHIKGVDLNITTEEIVEIVREGRGGPI